MAHDLIIQVLNLEKRELKTNRVNNISHLKLFIGKGGSGKLCILDSVIILLKNLCKYKDNNYLIMVPTSKAGQRVCISTINSHKDRLSLPIRDRLKKFQGKIKDYF